MVTVPVYYRLYKCCAANRNHGTYGNKVLVRYHGRFNNQITLLGN